MKRIKGIKGIIDELWGDALGYAQEVPAGMVESWKSIF